MGILQNTGSTLKVLWITRHQATCLRSRACRAHSEFTREGKKAQMDRRFVLTATVILLLLALLHPGSQASPMEANSSDISLTPIGLDYLDLPDVPGFGQVCVDSAQNIWVMSRDKPCILRYSLKSGFEEVVPWGNPRPQDSPAATGILCVINGDAYALRHVEAPSAKDTLLKRYELHLLKPDKAPLLVQSFTVFHSGNPFSGIDPYIVALNSDYVFTVENLKKGPDDQPEDVRFPDTYLWRTDRASGRFDQVVTSPRLPPGPLVACDDKNVYFLKDASALRIYDASTMTEKQKYKIPKQVIGEATMLIRTSTGLYAGNSSGQIGFFSTNRQGTIIHSSAVVKTGKVANMRSFYPCGSGFVALGADAGADSSSVNLYYFTRLSIKPKLVHQVHVPLEVVHSTGAIAALSGKICLNSGSMLKIVENGTFREEIEARGIPGRISINRDGVIAYTYSDGKKSLIATVDRHDTRTYPVPRNPRGAQRPKTLTMFNSIEADNDGAFLILASGADTQLLRFDYKNGEFTTFFAIDELETTFIDLAVLPNDDIVLTSSYLVQVRNRKGDIVKESSESLYPYGEIKSIAYSHALNRILAITDSGRLLAFEPGNLNLELVVEHPDLSGIRDIAASDNGELYVARGIYPHRVFRVSGIDTLLSSD